MFNICMNLQLANSYFEKWICKGAIPLSAIKKLHQDEDVSFTGKVLERLGSPKKPGEMENETTVQHTINWSIRYRPHAHVIIAIVLCMYICDHRYYNL